MTRSTEADVEQTNQYRIDGRIWAEEALEGLEGESPEFAEGFWRAIRRRSPKPSPIASGAMSDEQAREFGKKHIRFGQHSGDRYDAVPLDYLEWLSDANAELARYLGSRRIQAEQATED
jgi:hypothetical protein